MWGFAESVLVDGPWVICTPGGEKNTIVALDKTNGNQVWGAAVGDKAGYASVIKATIDGVDQYVNLTAKGVISVRAKDGKFLWRYDAPASKVANCSACIVSGNSVFAASGYNIGGGRADITRNGDEFEAKEVFFCKKMQNHHGGMILVQRHDLRMQQSQGSYLPGLQNRRYQSGPTKARASARYCMPTACSTAATKTARSAWSKPRPTASNSKAASISPIAAK